MDPKPTLTDLILRNDCASKSVGCVNLPILYPGSPNSGNGRALHTRLSCFDSLEPSTVVHCVGFPLALGPLTPASVA